jgi:hypothetical protein
MNSLLSRVTTDFLVRGVRILRIEQYGEYRLSVLNESAVLLQKIWKIFPAINVSIKQYGEYRLSAIVDVYLSQKLRQCHCPFSCLCVHIHVHVLVLVNVSIIITISVCPCCVRVCDRVHINVLVLYMFMFTSMSLSLSMSASVSVCVLLHVLFIFMFILCWGFKETVARDFLTLVFMTQPNMDPKVIPYSTFSFEFMKMFNFEGFSPGSDTMQKYI